MADDGSTDGAAELALGMGNDRTADGRLQMAAEELVTGQTAAEEDAALHGQAGSEGGRTAADGADNTQRNVVTGDILCQQADDLALGENGAHAGDVNGGTLGGEGIQLVAGALQNTAHHFDETTCACGTFVVHQEVGNIAFLIQKDGLAVLTADIDNTTDIAAQEMGALGVAGDLGDLLIGLGQQLAAITCGDDIADIFIPRPDGNR